MIAWAVAACARPEPVVVARVDPDSGRALVVATAGPVRIERDGHALAGRTAEGRFESAAPLGPGTYTVTAGPTRASFVVPEPPTLPPPTVSVLPQLERVPANHLRFYLSFSRPMRAHDLFEHLALIDEASGEPVPLAFSEFEVWDADRRVLTLLLHPGRQKRGIGFAKELGPVLIDGRRYALRIDGALEAADGQAIGSDVFHRFTAAPDDRSSPDPEAWTIAVADTVRIELDEPLDPRLLASAFAVVDADGVPVDAAVDVAPDGRSVELAPTGTGPWRLERVGPVEDLAGNTPERLFDH